MPSILKLQDPNLTYRVVPHVLQPPIHHFLVRIPPLDQPLMHPTERPELSKNARIRREF
jgi:hypothetical protein